MEIQVAEIASLQSLVVMLKRAAPVLVPLALLISFALARQYLARRRAVRAGRIARRQGLQFEDSMLRGENGEMEEGDEWRIAGEYGGREYRIEGRRDEADNETAAISMDCRHAAGTRVVVGNDCLGYFRRYRPNYVLKRLRLPFADGLRDNRLFAEIKGRFDPGLVEERMIGRMLAEKASMGVALVIEDMRATLYCDARRMRIPEDEKFVRAAVAGLAELAEKVEEGNDAPTGAPREKVDLAVFRRRFWQLTGGLYALLLGGIIVAAIVEVVHGL